MLTRAPLLIFRSPSSPFRSTLAPRHVRSIVNNAVAPQVGWQNNYDFSRDTQEELQGGGGGQGSGKGDGGKKGGNDGPSGFRTSIESMLATGAGIALLALSGAGYHYWYKWEVLRKMERAFTKGYDPVLELAKASKFDSDGSVKKGRIRRKEQDYIDKVMNGEITGECKFLLFIRLAMSLLFLSTDARLAHDRSAPPRSERNW